MKARALPKDLREARDQAGLTQVELALRCGVTAQAVSQWETRATVPMGSSRLLLSQALGTTLDVVESWFAREERAA